MESGGLVLDKRFSFRALKCSSNQHFTKENAKFRGNGKDEDRAIPLSNTDFTTTKGS